VAFGVDGFRDDVCVNEPISGHIQFPLTTNLQTVSKHSSQEYFSFEMLRLVTTQGKTHKILKISRTDRKNVETLAVFIDCGDSRGKNRGRHMR